MKKCTFLVVLCFMLGVSAAQAGGIDLTGKRSIGIMGSYQNWSSDDDDHDDSDIDVLSGGINLSYFLDKNWEIGLSGTGNYAWDDSDNDHRRRYHHRRWHRHDYDDDDDDDDERGAISLEGICNYNITTGQNWMPYVGAAIGGVYYGTGDDEEWGTSLGAQAGLKFFASETVYFNVEYRYRRWLVDTDDDHHGRYHRFSLRYYDDDDDDDDDLNSHGVFVGVNWMF